MSSSLLATNVRLLLDQILLAWRVHGGSTRILQGIPLVSKRDTLMETHTSIYEYAKNVCSIYNISFCRDESCSFMRNKHLAFQCEYNDDETLASYAKRNYDFYDAKQIEEFVAYKGAYEITSLLKKFDDAPYKSESLSILNYCLENYDANYYITDHLERISPPKEETNVLQDSMED